MLEKVARTHGLPQVITTDNGTEFTCRDVDEWAHRNGVKLDFIRPRKRLRAHPSKASTEGFGRSAWSSTGLSRWRTQGRRSRLGGSTTMSTGRIRRWGTIPPESMRPDGSYPGPRRREFFNPKIGPKKGAGQGDIFERNFKTDIVTGNHPKDPQTVPAGTSSGGIHARILIEAVPPHGIHSD